MTTIFAALHIDASYLVASILVAFYAAGRFNTPRTVRSQTTRFQYFASCVTYVLSCQGLLMLMTWLLGQRPDWLGVLHLGSSERIPENLQGLDSALVAALMLTTLLPSFPVLRDFDAAMLRFFHKLGAIPIGAIRWSQRMNSVPFTIHDQLLADVRNHISNSPLLPDALIGELQTDFAVSKARFRFTRNLALYVFLRSLPGFPRFAADFHEDMAAFEKRMSSFFAQCVGFFALANQLSSRELDSDQASEGFRSLTLEAFEDIRLMLARVLLYSCNDESEVAQQLARAGFAIERREPILIPFNLLTLDIIGVVALFAGATFISAGQMPPGKALAIGLLVAVNHSIAAGFALLPKRVWSFADIRCSGERPILAYVISAACTLTVALPVSYGFYMVRLHLLPLDSAPIMAFAAQCKWLVSPTILSAALAFACDDFARTDREANWLRWIECAALAALMAIAGLFVVQWLQIDRVGLYPGGSPPPLWVSVLLSALIGGLFGGTIPGWYRRTVRDSEARTLVPPSVRQPSGLVEAI